MDTTPAPRDAELRAVMVRTDQYVFELHRSADGQNVVTYTPITETTPAQGAGASEPEEF